jgi:elongation factor G
MKRAKGNGQYAKVTITLEPGERGSGIEFESQIKGGVVPKEYVPSVEKGIRSAATSGPLGYPVVDFKATLTDGQTHDQDSSPYAFEIAGHRAAKGGFEQAGTALLEPIMDAEIRVPQQFVGGVMGDIAKRRGKITGMSQDSIDQIINAEVPLSETFGWITELRGMTQGQGSCSLQFLKYGEVPSEIQDQIVNRWK